MSSSVCSPANPSVTSASARTMDRRSIRRSSTIAHTRSRTALRSRKKMLICRAAPEQSARPALRHRRSRVRVLGPFCNFLSSEGDAHAFNQNRNDDSVRRGPCGHGRMQTERRRRHHGHGSGGKRYIDDACAGLAGRFRCRYVYASGTGQLHDSAIGHHDAAGRHHDAAGRYGAEVISEYSAKRTGGLDPPVRRSPNYSETAAPVPRVWRFRVPLNSLGSRPVAARMRSRNSVMVESYFLCSGSRNARSWRPAA